MARDDRTERFATGVLVIGAGAAGLRASIELAERGLPVLCLARRDRSDAHTVLAAGGINAALATTDPQDSWEQHAADTLREGYWLNDPRAVEILATESWQAIDDLVRWGVPFARDERGELHQRFFGAHRWRRTCYAGDYTGREMQLALLRRAGELRIDLRDGIYVTRLLVSDGQVFGAYGFDIADGRRYVVYADAVVLAGGGHTRVYRRSSSRRDENTGDAMRLALEAGCRLRDMELVQFHPTGMVFPQEAAGTLVTEAVRGEGGILRNAEGERFMERYDPARLELSSRDRVALANYTEIDEGRGTEHGAVLLDVSHLPREQIFERLPRMYRQFVDLAMVDMTRTAMEVAPTAHYTMGGVRVDAETHATDVAGLYAAGECAAGVHGANRLGGNSLSETLVFGRIAAAQAARFADGIGAQLRSHRAVRDATDEVDELLDARGSELVRPLQRAVRDTMWEHCAVIRSDHGLRTALSKLDEIEARTARIEVHPDIAGFEDLARAFHLRSAIASARATVACARERRETRGAHNRSDFPDLDPAFQVNLTYSADGEITHEPVGATPEAIREHAQDRPDLESAGRLLE
ncbi:MAG: succinate dehydrogenase / fumarate reductase, flavoprotein subunit [Solirubrobacteraceae bacterium]|jgi:succinate dehydrogenase / fumarate reductase flavoprotein subunit|nr:succinate dehydrogenase / fumarate reductase, flavoprotein subunit [Solirubrobacteraceae bacterium]